MHEFLNTHFSWTDAEKKQKDRTTVPPLLKNATASQKASSRFQKGRSAEKMRVTGIAVDRHVSLLLAGELPRLQHRERFHNFGENTAQQYAMILREAGVCSLSTKEIKMYDRRALAYVVYMCEQGYTLRKTQVHVGKTHPRLETNIDHIWFHSKKNELVLVELKVRHIQSFAGYETKAIGLDIRRDFSPRSDGTLTQFDKHQIQAALNQVLYCQEHELDMDAVKSMVVIINGGHITTFKLQQHFLDRAVKFLSS